MSAWCTDGAVYQGLYCDLDLFGAISPLMVYTYATFNSFWTLSMFLSQKNVIIAVKKVWICYSFGLKVKIKMTNQQCGAFVAYCAILSTFI